MANHGFLSFRKKLDLPGLRDLCQEICNDHLPNFVADLYPENSPPIVIVHHKDKDSDEDWEHTLGIWFRSPKKIEVRHNPGDFYWWLNHVIWDNLAIKLNGRISDEGVEGTWAGEFKYPTFVKFLKSMYKNPIALQIIMQDYLKHLPDHLLETIDGVKS